jgi:hypothetical protein
MRKAAGAFLALFLAIGGCARGAMLRASEPPVPESTYDLRLDVSDSLEKVTGMLALRYANPGTAPLDHLQFFLFPNLTAGAMEINSCMVGGTPVLTSSEMHDSKLNVRLPHPLPAGASLDVAIDFTVTVPLDPRGELGGFSRAGSTLAMAWCYPVVLAPEAWDNGVPIPYADYLCKEPSRYTARITFPAGLQIAAPGTEKGRRTANGRTIVDLAHGPARDFFLALGRDMAEAVATTGEVSVRCFAPQGRHEAAAFAAETAAKALAAFAQRFGAYPFASLTLVAVPLASYGLEFPGIVAISDRIFDLAGTVNGISVRNLLESTVAHETAHQWFYGVVGNDQVKEPWLDEPLAQYATWLYFRDRYGAARAESYYATFDERWNRVGRASIPIGLNVGEYSEKEYGAILYGRGPLFLRALSDAMGEETFDRFAREWVRRFAGRIAAGKDFFDLASAMAGRDLAGLFEQWVWPTPR